MGSKGIFGFLSRSTADSVEDKTVTPAVEPPKEHPAVAALRTATLRINQMPVSRDTLLQLVEGSTQVWNQSLSAYRDLCIQSKYEEGLAKALADYAEAAAHIHVRSIAYAGDSLSMTGRETAAASGMRYWRIRKQLQCVSGGRFASLNEIPGRILAATGMQRQELEIWFEGRHSQYREAFQDFMVGTYLDAVPFNSLSLIQSELVFRFFDRIGPELRLISKAADPQRERTPTVEEAVFASGMGGVTIKNIYMDFPELRTRLMEATGSLRREGIPPHFQGFSKNPAILVAMLVPVLAHWSPERPRRKTDRVEEKGQLEVVLGVPDILRTLRGEAATTVDTWTRIDHHDSGVGALALSLRKDYQPGGIIGLRQKTSDIWHVGIIRRINRIEGGRYSIGIQLLNRIAARVLETEMDAGKIYQTYCLHMDQAIILNRAQIPQGRLLKIHTDPPVFARNFSIAEVGGNYELHLLAEEPT